VEVVCDPGVSGEIVKASGRFGVEARVIGHTEHREEGASLTIVTAGETIEYERRSVGKE
jgi:hypothetical protein